MKNTVITSLTLFCCQSFAQVGTPPAQRPPVVPPLNVAATSIGDEVIGIHLAEAIEAPVARLNILIVDDEEGVILSPRRHLTVGLGHEVTVARGGAQAVLLLAERAFDLILMDHNMPEMDGLETTRVLRAQQVHTPIVSHSTNDFDPNTREQYEALGVIHFFNKGAPSKAAYERLLSEIQGERVVQ